MENAGRSKAGPYAALALAIGMLAYRLVQLRLAPFSNDAPQFLAAARAQILPGGHWAEASPVYGNFGLPYGPTVFWFYGAVQSFLGADPVYCIGAMCLLVTLAQVTCAAAVTRAFGGGKGMFAAVLAVVAASPYAFILSRMAWDQMSLVCAQFAVALIARRERFGPVRAVLLGAVLGLGLSSHLMIAPFVLLVAVLLIADLWRQPKRLFGLGALTAGVMIFVNIPYLRFLSRVRPHPKSLAAFDPASVWPYLRETARVYTGHQMQYTFGSDWGPFLDSAGRLRPLVESPPWIWMTCTAVAVAGLLAALWVGGAARRMGLFAAACWLGYGCFYAVRQVPVYSHYQFPIWWVVPVGVAGALVGARRLSPVLGRVACGVVFCAAGLQFVTLPLMMAFVKEHDGIGGNTYSTPVAREKELTRAVCALPEREILIENQTQRLRPTDYISRVEPSCRGKTLLWCLPGDCPQASPGQRRIRLFYPRPVGAALAFE